MSLMAISTTAFDVVLSFHAFISADYSVDNLFTLFNVYVGNLNITIYTFVRGHFL